MSNTEGEKNNFKQRQITWSVPEYEKYERSKKWYILSSILAVFILVYSVFSGNYLFAVIVILFSFIAIIHDGKNPQNVDILLDSDGLSVGNKFYEYDELKNFSVIYKPSQEIRQLYFEFNNNLKQRISIPLNDTSPLEVRKFLLKYMDEDLERKNIPTSEYLARLFKL